MVEKRTRRRFTAEFKAETVTRSRPGFSPGQLSSWRNE